MADKTVFSWSVRHRLNDHSEIINHRTRGGAIAEYLRDVRDCWPDVRFTDLRARKLGVAYTSNRLARVAEYRGMPWVRAGMRVIVCGDSGGVIVDGNDSANFEVLMDDSGYTANCHPCDLSFPGRAAAQAQEGGANV